MRRRVERRDFNDPKMWVIEGEAKCPKGHSLEITRLVREGWAKKTCSECGEDYSFEELTDFVIKKPE